MEQKKEENSDSSISLRLIIMFCVVAGGGLLIHGQMQERQTVQDTIPRHQVTSEDAYRVRRLQDNIDEIDVGVVWVSFRTETGGEYLAIHVLKHTEKGLINPQPGPYILLTSKDFNRVEFREVMEKVSAITHGEPEGDRIEDRRRDICQTIILPKDFGKEDLKELIQRYAECFYTILQENLVSAEDLIPKKETSVEPK